jgi:hypothetical protein
MTPLDFVHSYCLSSGPSLFLVLLTQKFGTGRSLSCGPSLVKESVRKKEGFYRKIRQRSSRSAVGFRSVRNLFALILWDLCGDVARAEGTNGWIRDRT